MTESYELPVLFTDDECKAYAAWGMKKEKVLMPFALITIDRKSTRLNSSHMHDPE